MPPNLLISEMDRPFSADATINRHGRGRYRCVRLPTPYVELLSINPIAVNLGRACYLTRSGGLANAGGRESRSRWLTRVPLYFPSDAMGDHSIANPAAKSAGVMAHAEKFVARAGA